VLANESRGFDSHNSYIVVAQGSLDPENWAMIPIANEGLLYIITDVPLHREKTVRFANGTLDGRHVTLAFAARRSIPPLLKIVFQFCHNDLDSS
jgi:hypothetical protein